MAKTALTATNSAGYATPVGLAADAVIFTVIDGELNVLLARRPEAPHKGDWALPGGFVGESEDPQDTIVRKLFEKTGMDAIYVEQLRTYATPGRDSRGWLPSIAYIALVTHGLLPEQHATDAAWHPVSALPALPFDHGTMVADGVERLRGKLWYSNIAVGLLPPEFTIAEALTVYEAISGVSYEVNNFRRRLQKTELVSETGHTRAAPGGGRPAATYRFNDFQPAWGRSVALGA